MMHPEAKGKRKLELLELSFNLIMARKKKGKKTAKQKNKKAKKNKKINMIDVVE